jgi:hypothetical protein
MAVISQPGQADNREVAKRIKGWLDGKGFETKALEASGSYVIKARKASTVRAVFGADRALEVEVRHADNQTQVDVRQGSWKTNAISNVAWLVATGGMNLAFTGWSLVIQKELETFIRGTLGELAGLREVDL